VIAIRFAHGSYAAEFCTSQIARRIADREFAGMWRTLARPVILFDERSPENIPANDIGEFFGKKRARQDSNLRPPA